jgi:NADH dehydrogenase [ubiquinone] 1 alpha subcomplex assembly factor 7
MSDESLADRLDRHITTAGPIPVADYVEAALYDPVDGFYASRGRAGRGGDFLTAPEVGPLFGTVIAGAIDTWWFEMGRPAPFAVIEWGAGPGTLARAVTAASPAVLASGALQWHLVESSAMQRQQHPNHPAVFSWATGDDALRAVLAATAATAATPGPAPLVGVVLANELLDNLPFDIVTRHGDRWHPLRIGSRDDDGRFRLERDSTPLAGPAQIELDGLAPGTPDGVLVPWQPKARAWLREARAALGRGRVVVFDYGASTAELAGRSGRGDGPPGWLRTHRDHQGGLDWRRDPGSCDITSDVAFDQLELHDRADIDRSQADWLRAHGIDVLVEDGRRRWEETAGIGDLAALRARSRIREADALLDPDGMGAFRVVEWVI